MTDDILDKSILPSEIKDSIAPPGVYILEPPPSNIAAPSCDDSTFKISAMWKHVF